MENTFVLLILVYPNNKVKAFPYISYLRLDRDKDLLSIKCFNNEHYWAMKYSDIKYLYTIGGIEKGGKYYFYHKMQNKYVPVDDLTVHLLRFDSFYGDANDGNPFDSNMNVVSQRLIEWCNGVEPMTMSDDWYLEQLILASKEREDI